MTSSNANSLFQQHIAVTGASGFIGKSLVRHLVALGVRVTAVVDRSRCAAADRARLLPDTVCFDDAREIAAIVRNIQPDSVVHLHAAVTTARDADAVHMSVHHNLLPSLDLMEACKDLGLQRLIMMGSGEEFGLVTGSFDDTTNANPPSPYGASKAAITCYAKMYSNAFGLPIVVLRPSVVYGPRQAPRMLIPQVMQALRRGCPIDVTAGAQTRDFIHVEDVARGIVASLTAPAVTGRSWNLGTGEVVTVRDCLERLESITGVQGLIRYGALPYKQGEIFTYEPHVLETYEAFGWRPAIGLDQGLRATWLAGDR